MNKSQNGLLVVAIMYFATSSLVASEKPFFDKQTQEVVNKTAKYYGHAYAGLYVVGTGLIQCAAFIGTPAILMNEFGSTRGFFDSNKQQRQRYIKTTRGLADPIISIMRRAITRSAVVTAPIVFGSTIAYHKYQADNHQDNAKRINE